MYRFTFDKLYKCEKHIKKEKNPSRFRLTHKLEKNCYTFFLLSFLFEHNYCESIAWLYFVL